MESGRNHDDENERRTTPRDRHQAKEKAQDLWPDQAVRSPVAPIALTAHVRPEDEEEALASGFQMHLAKPIDSSKLLSAVTTTLVSSWSSRTMSYGDESEA